MIIKTKKMKRFLLVITLLGGAFSGFSQTVSDVEEPEYIGEVVYISDQAMPIALEKQPVKIQGRAGASLYLTGIGKIKSKMVIQGTASPVILKKDTPLTFIIKNSDNKSDPLSIISVIKFETTKKERKAETASLGTFSGSTTNNENHAGYNAKKYKDSSYGLKTNGLEEGGYGIIFSNPNA